MGSAVCYPMEGPFWDDEFPGDEKECDPRAEMAEALGAEIIDVLRLQCEERCPQMWSVYGTVLSLEDGPDHAYSEVVIGVSDGYAVAATISTDTYTAWDLAYAASRAEGRVVALLAPPVDGPWPRRDALLVAICITPVDAPGCLVELASCGLAFGISEDVWPSKMHLVKPYLVKPY